MKRNGIGFGSVMFMVGLVGAIYVGFWPLILEQWARHAWEKVPCNYVATTGNFIFEYHGKKYECSQANMWRTTFHGDAFPATTEVPMGEINGDCYVNGGEPPVAVGKLDAFAHLDQGIGHFVGAGLILLAAALVGWGSSWQSRKRKMKNGRAGAAGGSKPVG